MNRTEEQVLHGLYCLIGAVNHERLVSSEEILWLTKTRIPNTKQWRAQDGKLKSCTELRDDYLDSLAATSTAASRPLRYLDEAGYISFQDEGSVFRVSLTAQGADLARKLDTRLGRADIWYMQKKDGLIGLLITIGVSFITTVVTNWWLR